NGTEYTYDALGNLIYRQLPNGENQYFVYDTENQLTRAEIKKSAGNTEIWEYAYDPFGRRLSKERKDKLAWVSTEPKRTHFVWDGTRLLQEYTYKGNYTYVYTDQDSYEPLAQVFLNSKDDKQYLAYFHTDQIGIPKEMTDQFGNLLWYGEYTAWGRLKKDERVYKDVHQPFRLQNQYCDAETGLHYNFFRYYEPDTGRFVNQDPIKLYGGSNLYLFGHNTFKWKDPLGLTGNQGITTFYHAGDIQGPIDPSKGRLNLDFNPAGQGGFYVTTDRTQAETWAQKRGLPSITQFDIPNSELNKLDIKTFQSANSEWGDFVTQGRNGTLQHSHDAVSGPMLANPRDAKRGKPPKPIGSQFAIFTERAARLFNRFKKPRKAGC
ncbi:RHS repeat-associated core domain-containing protein, partial [Neisseria dentiae]